MKLEIYPDKAQYLKGEIISLYIECSDKLLNYTATINVYKLSKIIKNQQVILKQNTNKMIVGVFNDNFTGYGVDLELNFQGNCLKRTTAFDVVKDHNLSMRYGFLSDFSESDKNNNKDLNFMRKFHVNYIQYYDWSFRHDNLVSNKNIYDDMMNKHISIDTVKKKISIGHKYGIQSIAYGAVYAASDVFYDSHKNWGLFNSSGRQFKFINIFNIMNIEEDCPWHKYIINQYKRAIELIGFDGIHMDTYGFPKTAFSHWGEPHIVNLKDCFQILINNTKKELEKIKKVDLIFNNVGNWPVKNTANTFQSAIYIEVWKPYEKYNQIKQIINEAKEQRTDAKPIILAAYLSTFKTSDEINSMYAALILTAIIVSNGAYHLLIGEEGAILTQGYYSDYYKMSKKCCNKLKEYYDFTIRYMNIFYDIEMTEVTMTHLGGDNYEYQCLFDNWSIDGDCNKVMVSIFEKPKLKVINLINLCGCQNNKWDCEKQRPIIQKNLKFRVYIDFSIKSLFTATPDMGTPELKKIKYTVSNDEKGQYIEFVINQLNIWKFVYIEFK